MHSFLQYALTVALLCLCSSSVMAQNNTQISCQNATSLTSLNSSFVGEWYEASRSPASNSSCVGLNIFTNTSGLYLNLTVSASNTLLYENTTVSYSLANSTVVSSNETSPAGGYVFVPTANVNVTIKVLMTDNTNYALVCGYYNNTGSTFGAILTRQRPVSNATLTSYVTMGNASYADFANMTAVVQNSTCYLASSAASHVSMLSLIVATIYAMLKLIN
ncbi:uncharacterized protein LOC129253014 [Anastrepha obliqua]|uniref:uncharacterized protein LOC129253014 n=1 Tax=Anastrepha obliqua TaxID=95512 RepID=UPI002409376E|nr:uncharacterized protein LOC129253014 [Anastrepha obliqua]